MKSAFIRAVALHGFGEYVRSQNGDPVFLMQSAGIDPSLLDRYEGVMSYNKGVLLYEQTAKYLNDPDFGLHLALAAVPHFTNFGPVIYAGYMEKTFRSWLASMLAYQKDYTDGHVGELIDEPDSGKAIFRLNTTAHTFSLRQAIEMKMAGLCLLVQQVIPQDEVKPEIVRFRHPKPESTKLHQSIFNAPIEFGCEHDEIEFKREWLNIR
ncbi:MAG: AraC family transcriptional regulator ligand-binding domain-containing protein, partial [Salaquimonas sp.]